MGKSTFVSKSAVAQGKVLARRSLVSTALPKERCLRLRSAKWRCRLLLLLSTKGRRLLLPTKGRRQLMSTKGSRLRRSTKGRLLLLLSAAERTRLLLLSSTERS